MSPAKRSGSAMAAAPRPPVLRMRPFAAPTAGLRPAAA